MKKFFTLFLSFCLIFMLTACKQSATPTDTPSDNIESEEILSNEEETYDPYPMIEISDDKITIDENKKTFNALDVSFSVPLDWECLQQSGEDSTSYFFREPKLDEKCRFTFYITGSDYFNGNITIDDEYLKHLEESFNTYSGEKLQSITKETIDGHECVKYVTIYSKGDIEFIDIDFEDLIIGDRMYCFSVYCLKSKYETFEPIFDSIINSIEFKAE